MKCSICQSEKNSLISIYSNEETRYIRGWACLSCASKYDNEELIRIIAMNKSDKEGL